MKRINYTKRQSTSSVLVLTALLLAVGALILHLGKLIIVADQFGKGFGF